MPALIKGDGARPEPDRPAILSFLLLGGLHGQRTGFRGVHRLMPGERLELRGGRPRRSFALGPEPEAPAGTEDAVRRFSGLCCDAVERSLKGCGPRVAACFSGGLDSSALLYWLRRGQDRGRDVTAATYVFDGHAGGDGATFAGLVAKAFRIRHEIVVLTRPDLGASARAAVQGSADLSDFPLLAQIAFFKRLSDAGWRDVMHAAGPDFTQHRPSTTPWLDVWSLYKRLPGSARAPVSALLRAVPVRGFTTHVLRTIGEERLDRLWLYLYVQLSFEGAPKGCPEGLWKDLLRSPGVRWYSRMERRLGGRTEDIVCFSQRMLGSQLMSQMEKLAGLQGIRLALPWMDPAVTGFLSACPAALKQRGPDGKFLLRESMRGLVPEGVLARRKKPFESFFPLEWRDAWTSPGQEGGGYMEKVRRSGILSAGEFRWFSEHPRRRFRLALLGLWLETWF